MKKLLFILAIALTGCTAEEMAVEPCTCRFDAKRYISFNQGLTWSFNSYDGRHNMVLDCDLERELINYVEGENYIYKTVFKCR